MPSGARASGAGGEVTSTESVGQERVRSSFDAYNELVRTDGDVLAWVREWFHPHAEYRPIEDRDWFHDPETIARSITRWMETWGKGTHRITPKEILALGEERFLIAALNNGIGRLSGVPIEATTYIATRWQAGAIIWFDEYLDKEAALAAAGEQVPATGGAEPAASAPVAERVWTLSEAALAAFVPRRSDRQLERLFSSDRALQVIFRRMEQLFVPAKAGDFVGEIQYEVLVPNGVKRWVVRIQGDQARAEAGEVAAPVTTLKTSLPVFIRMAARELHPLTAYRDGLLEVSGDFGVATRIEAMFGLSAKQPD